MFVTLPSDVIVGCCTISTTLLHAIAVVVVFAFDSEADGATVAGAAVSCSRRFEVDTTNGFVPGMPSFGNDGKCVSGFLNSKSA